MRPWGHATLPAASRHEPLGSSRHVRPLNFWLLLTAPDGTFVDREGPTRHGDHRIQQHMVRRQQVRRFAPSPAGDGRAVGQAPRVCV